MGNKIKIIDISGNRIQKKPKANQVDLTATDGELQLNDAPIGGGGSENGWNLNGNNASPSQFIGTTNAAALIIKTNDSEIARFKIDGDFDLKVGNIGLGTQQIIEFNGDDPNWIMGRLTGNTGGILSYSSNQLTLGIAGGAGEGFSIVEASDSNLPLFQIRGSDGGIYLPSTGGTIGQTLTNDGTGYAYWATGAGSPAGSFQNIQVNNGSGGFFADSAGNYYNGNLTVGSGGVNGAINIKNSGNHTLSLQYTAGTKDTTWFLPSGFGAVGTLLESIDGNGNLDFTGILHAGNGSSSYDINARTISDGLVGTSVDGANRLLVDSGGTATIDWGSVAGLIKLIGVPSYINDAAATGAGLVSGNLYKTTTGGITALNIVP